MLGPSKLLRHFDRPLRSGARPLLQPEPIHQSRDAPIENKVVRIWNALLDKAQVRRQLQPQPRLFSKIEVMPNETGVRCLDNEHVLRIDTGISGVKEKPIHAHRTRQESQDVEHGAVVYAAGQSPHAESIKDFLVQSLVSKQGAFEFVSRKAHYDADDSTVKSIMDLLKIEITKARDSHTKLIFGNRYEYQSLHQIAGKGCVDGEEDFLRCELTVIDRHTRAKITVPLTQVGLKFTNQLLLPAEICRADSLLIAHQEAVKSCGHTNQTGSPAVQLILSRAGSGRNATLISYHKISHLIEGKLVTEATLDAMLEEEIDAERMRRGPTYVHSVEQLASLRTALLDKITSVSRTLSQKITEPGQHSSVPDWLRRNVSSAKDALSLRSKKFNQQSGLSSKVAALPVQANDTNVDIKVAIPHSPYHALSSIAEESVVNSTETQEKNSIKQSSSMVDGIAEDETIKRINPTLVNGVSKQDGPINPAHCTRYTNDKIDMSKADLLLCGAVMGLNYQRKLVTDDGGSWWRAAFVSVLMEHITLSPNKTQDAAKKIAERVRTLGTDFIQEAAILEQMMMQVANNFIFVNGHGRGIRGFMTDLHPPMGGKELFAIRPLFLSGTSRLKAVGEDDNDLNRPGETALKKIAHAMLLKAGFSAGTVERLFNEGAKEEGTATHIVELMNQLGAREGMIFTRPWMHSNPNSSSQPWLDFKSATLDVYAMNQPLGEKCDEDLGIQQGSEVEKFIYAQAYKPVIVAENGHFSILIDAMQADGSGYA